MGSKKPPLFTFHLKEVTDARSIQGEGEAGDERADS